jgi:hypothetical protein
VRLVRLRAQGGSGEPSESQKHVDLWRASNSGLFGCDEALFHTHQAYAVEDLNMTRLLVTSLIPDIKDCDVAIAANILIPSTNSGKITRGKACAGFSRVCMLLLSVPIHCCLTH